MKKWKTAAALFMLGIAVTLSGCGSEPGMLEEYSFGTVQLKAGNSEIYMASPFDLAHVERPGGAGMMYINKDDNVVVLAQAQPLTGGNAQTAAEQDAARQKQADYSDLKMKLSPTTINGKDAVDGEYTFTISVKGEPVTIVSRNIFFEDTDQVWHITYQYRQGDAMGEEVVRHVFGQIH